MTDITMVLFDVNGVLYHYDRDARITSLSMMTGKAPEEIKAAIWDSGFEDQGDAGVMDAEAYLEAFGQRLQTEVMDIEWLAALRASVKPIHRAIALMERLRPGIACAALTNNNLLVQEHFELLFADIADLIEDRACVSAEFGARKPDPDVYRRCVARLGVTAAETLFIDDNEANVAGAQAAGLAACHSTTAKELESALLRFGVLI